jgi:hypothetical protein
LLTEGFTIRGETLLARRWGSSKKSSGKVKCVGSADWEDGLAGGGVFRRPMPWLSGLQGNASDVAGGEHFAIGSEKQFAAYMGYPKKAEGPAVRLWRVPSGFLAETRNIPRPLEQRRKRRSR